MPLINVPCDRRSRYQLYGLDWRHCALRPDHVVVAMLLLFFWCFNAPDTLKGSRSGWCLCNSTAELEASSLTREAECVFYMDGLLLLGLVFYTLCISDCSQDCCHRCNVTESNLKLQDYNNIQKCNLCIGMQPTAILEVYYSTYLHSIFKVPFNI